jgi:hypothetical protein
MKNKVIIICSIIFFITNALCFGQEIETAEKEKKIAYSFFAEYGFGVGGLSYGEVSMDFTGVLVNGISFNKKQDMVGIGIGCDLFFVISVQAYPIFVNYRHYFSSKTKYKPLINIAIGTEFSSWNRQHRISSFAGLYTTVASGFRYKALSFTSGFFVKSWEMEEFHFRYGVEIKVGYTF